jgi:hypothetical protein
MDLRQSARESAHPEGCYRGRTSGGGAPGNLRRTYGVRA